MTLAHRRRARAAPPQPKKILILGGTAFLGPALVAAARAHGHTLTLFNRGKTNPGRFPDLEQLHGDRDGHLEALAGRKWDVVIDDSGYVPRLVKDSATLLGPNVGHYVFVSTISVYADLGRPVDEDAPLATLKAPTEKVRARELRRAQGAVRTGGADGDAGPRHRGAARADRRPRRSDRSLHLLAGAPGARRRGAGAGPAERSGRLHRRARSRRLDGVARGRAAHPRHLQRARAGDDARHRRPHRRLPARRRRRRQADLGRRHLPRPTGRAAVGRHAGVVAARRRRQVLGAHQPRARGQGGAHFSPHGAETARDTLAYWKSLPEARRQKPRAGLAADRERKVLAAWHART